MFAGARQQQRQLNVLQCRQRRQQLKELEHEPDLVAAQCRQFGVVQLGCQLTRDLDLAGSRKIHRAAEIEQRGFAAAAAAQQRHHLAASKLQRHAAQRLHAAFVGLRNIANCDSCGKQFTDSLLVVYSGDALV